MKIDHIAVWTNRLEELKDFYCRYFQGKANQKYDNAAKSFSSYFISFDGGARLEIMRMPNLGNRFGEPDGNVIGLAHVAMAVESPAVVDSLTRQLETEGYTIAGQPRQTGDGYYESCVLDPDGNRVEIVAK